MEIANRQLDDTSTTVLKFIQENAPYLKTIESASELQEDAADTNPYGMNVAFMYQKDPDKFAIETPIPFLQHPAQPKVLEIEVPCEARTAVKLSALTAKQFCRGKQARFQTATRIILLLVCWLMIPI